MTTRRKTDITGPLAVVAALAALSLCTAASAARAQAGASTGEATAVEDRWQHLDPAANSVLGVSTDRAYRELLTRPGQPVIVGLIDAGFDLTHEDLKGQWWTNPGEIPDNGKDDDHDGYVDDVHGWNFTGALRHGNWEVTRVVRALGPRYAPIASADSADSARLPAAQRDTLALYRQAAADLERQRATARSHGDTEALEYSLNVAYDPYTSSAGADPATHFTGGSPDLAGEPAGTLHGTRGAGIIGALRHNGLGMDGIADRVRLLPVRVMTTQAGLRNTDLAAAIRYLVDHGARVINLSVGKDYAGLDVQLVDEAVQYAMRKDVLIVHAVGNDGRDLDRGTGFPSPVYSDGSGTAAAWIQVGASGPKDGERVVPRWSNFGRHTVDVFAPGTGIYATAPRQRYGTREGTSAAAPVVTGIAAVLRSRYPELTAVEVKDIILRSVTRITHDVSVVRDGFSQRVPFAELCTSGGIVNLYGALQLAAASRPRRAHGRRA